MLAGAKGAGRTSFVGLAGEFLVAEPGYVSSEIGAFGRALVRPHFALPMT